MKLEYLIWLMISAFAIVATSTPAKRSQKQEKVQTLLRRSEKKRVAAEDVRNDRRSAYHLNGNNEEEEREAQLESDELSEATGLKRRGQHRDNDDLDEFMLKAVTELKAIEANYTVQDIEEDIEDKLKEIMLMAYAEGFMSYTTTSSKRGFEKLVKKEIHGSEDDVQEEEEEKKKREETEQVEEEERMVSRETSGKIIEREPSSLSDLGTILYNTTTSTTLSVCFNYCKSDLNCDSILYIVNSKTCVLHSDL